MQPRTMTKRGGWVNPVLWLLAFLVVNALWSGVAQQEAPNEVNTATQFETFREVEVAPLPQFRISHACPPHDVIYQFNH